MLHGAVNIHTYHPNQQMKFLNFGVGATPSNALYSGISPSGIWGTIWGAGFMLAVCKANTLSPVLSSWPQ